MGEEFPPRHWGDSDPEIAEGERQRGEAPMGSEATEGGSDPPAPTISCEAKQLWDDPDLIEIPERTEDERRFLVIGMIAGRHWLGGITCRDDRIRITSGQAIVLRYRVAGFVYISARMRLPRRM